MQGHLDILGQKIEDLRTKRDEHEEHLERLND